MIKSASYLSCPMGWEHFAGHCYLALDQVALDDHVLNVEDCALRDVGIDLDWGGV